MRVVVEDTGIGIARMPLLFRMFQQGMAGGQRAPGLGISLALVKAITEQHGGRVWAESEGRGKGARFTIELPRIPAPDEAEAHDATIGAGKMPSVLLVEDNPDARTLLADGLEIVGFTVETAASGEEALEKLKAAAPPDVLLADIGLPGIDGYELMRRARLLPGMADVPALALTGYGQQEDVERAREAGFTEHLTKPVDLTLLEKRILELVAARQG